MPISREKAARYPKDWKAISLAIRERAGWVCEFCRIARQNHPHPVTRSNVVLTVAHLDHDETSADPDNLAAMCNRCHLIYDAHHHARNAAITRRKKKAIGDLFS